MNKFPRKNWLLRVLAQDASDQELREMFGDPNEWQPGQIAVLSIFSIRDFSVVSILDWDQVREMSTKHEFPDDNTIVSPNPFGSSIYERNDGSVPVLNMDYYGSHAYRSTHNPGEVSFVGPQHLYRTLGDLMKKEAETMFAELIPQFLGAESVLQAVQDYPQLKDWDLPSDFGEYHSFDVHGYEVQIVRDSRDKQQPPRPYYWYIRFIDPSGTVNEKRSIWNEEEKTEGIDGTWFSDIQSALASATKYLEYINPSIGMS